MNWPSIDLRDIFGDVPGCSACKERGEEIPLEATQTYSPALCAYVDSWECPECGHTVVRGDDPTITTADGERL